MAKLIRVSPDSGSTWHSLPGSTGGFELNGESIDDTILGQSFKSSQAGLIVWSIGSNAIYKGYAGYLAKILRPGTPTATTGESMTLVSGKTYKIDDTAKDVWDRSVAAVIYDGGSPVAASNIDNIDYLFGKVTFVSGYTVSGAVTCDVTYLPMSQLGKGQSFDLGMTAEPKDTTDFETAQGNNGYRTFDPGLRTVALDLSGVYNASVDARGDLDARNELVIEVDPVGTGKSIFRGFFKMITTGQSGDVGALEEETMSFELSVPYDDTISVVCSWEHDATTDIPDGVKDVLDAWLNETTIDVDYLPQGARGQSPLDGVNGTCIVTDVSLSGGLSDMNVFTASLQGSGAYAEV